jgi:tetratricopeptide (TPR) repeat protein
MGRSTYSLKLTPGTEEDTMNLRMKHTRMGMFAAMALLIAATLPAEVWGQKFSHSANINGVKERIVRAESQPGDRDEILRQAITLLETANLPNDKSDKYLEETFFYLGYLYYRLYQFDKAVAMYRNALTLGKRFASKGEKLSGGLLIYSIDETINDIKIKYSYQAGKAYETALKQAEPDSIRTYLARSIEKYELLLALDSTATINGQSQSTNVHGALANTYVQLMNQASADSQRAAYRANARLHLERFVSQEKENLPVHQYLFQLYFQDSEYEHCIEWIDRALAINKSDSASIAIKSFLIAQKALILDVTGKPDEALRTYEEAIRSNPDNADLHFNLARLYLARNETPKALAEFEIVKKLKPDDVESNYQVADELFRLYIKRRSQVIEENGGVKADPKKITGILKPDIESCRASIFDAIRVLEANADAAQDKAESSYRLGKSYNFLAELEGHLVYHLESKEKVKIQKPFFEKAVTYLKDAVALKPDNTSAWHQLGTAYLNLQMRKEAEDAFSKSK